MSIGSIIGGGVQLVRTQPRIVAKWTALYVLAAGIGMVAMRPFYAAILSFQQQMAVFQQQATMARAAGIAPPPMPGAVGTLMSDIFGFDVLFLLLGIVAFAAVVRAVVRPGDDRFAYLRIGMDELRLLGLGVLLFAGAIAIELVAVLGAVLIGALLGFAAGKAVGGIAIGVFMLVLLAGGLYLEVRISLAGAYTVMRRRIVIGEAWRATRGRFWMLFGVYLLLGFAYLIFTIVVVAATNPWLIKAWVTMDQQAQMVAVQQQMAWLAAGPSLGMIVQLLVFGVFAVVFGSVAVGAIATAALELATGDEQVEDRRAWQPTRE